VSREELVQAYIEGGLSRRAFIRRLVAAGVSVGAAASYAHLLAPPEAAADAQVSLDDHYPELDIGVRSGSIKRVAETGVVRIRVEVAGEGGTVQLGVDVRHRGRRRLIGRRKVGFPTPGSRVVKVPISDRGRAILASRERASLRVTATALDADLSDPGVVDVDTARRRLR
jgi:hypothetical protein